MRKNNRKPTLLQKKTVEILAENPRMPIGRAMREAGYSKNTALNPKSDFLERRGTAVALDQWREKLRGVGITEDLLAKKHLEWLFAKKTITSLTEPDKQVPDYTTQIKAGEMLRDDFGIKRKEENPDNLKKRITAEEFFNDD